MKHITKVESLSNIGSTRPIIAMDANERLKWVGLYIIEMVDLGLPSHIKWAKCNLGATHEIDLGSQFAWGELAQHEGWPDDKNSHPYDWNEYIHVNETIDELNRPNEYLTKYCRSGNIGDVDNLVELLPEDDIVTVTHGGSYRMPKAENFIELIEETDNTWESNFKGSGVSGWKFVNRNDSTKYIFLPCCQTYVSNIVEGRADEGAYWSSSLSDPEEADSLSASNLWFSNLNNNPTINVGYYDRCAGLQIRPVSD